MNNNNKYIMGLLVSSAAVIRIVTQRFSPLTGEKRCVTILITAAEETMGLQTEKWSVQRDHRKMKYRGEFCFFAYILIGNYAIGSR